MSLIQRKWLAMGARYALIALGSALVTRGWMTSADWAQIMPELLSAILVLVPTIVAGAKGKTRDVEVTQTALMSSPALTVEQVEQAVPKVFSRPSANR